MFYANMKREEKKIIKTTIHRVQVIISLKEIGEILEIPSNGIRLEEVEVEDDKFKDMIAKPNSPSKIEYKHLTPLGKLISRIISYNILPKTGSYTHISNDQFKAMYAIVKHLEVNWARVIYEFIKTKPSHFLAFPKSIIKLLKANKISPTGKGKICEAIIDYTTLKRMGLDRGEDREEELEEDPETPMPSNTQPSSSTTQEVSIATISSQNIVILEQLKKMSEDFKVFSETMTARVDKLESRSEEIWNFMRKKAQVTEDVTAPSEDQVPEATDPRSDKEKEVLEEEEEDVNIMEDEQVQAMIQELVQETEVQIDSMEKEGEQVPEVCTPSIDKGKKPMEEKNQTGGEEEDETMEE